MWKKCGKRKRAKEWSEVKTIRRAINSSNFGSTVTKTLCDDISIVQSRKRRRRRRNSCKFNRIYSLFIRPSTKRGTFNFTRAYPSALYLVSTWTRDGHKTERQIIETIVNHHKMLSNECERDIQLELNRNYLKSFPARLKFCHIVSWRQCICHAIPITGLIELWISLFFLFFSDRRHTKTVFRCIITVFADIFRSWLSVVIIRSDLYIDDVDVVFVDILGIVDHQLEDQRKNSHGSD